MFSEAFRQPLTRRSLLKYGAAAGIASQVTMLQQLAWLPNRLALAASALPDIQFDIGGFIPPAFSVNGVLVRFATVFTVFAPAKLVERPEKEDGAELAQALAIVEQSLPFSPSGIFTFVGYGIPYFNKLPGGMTGALVSSRMPRLAKDH